MHLDEDRLLKREDRLMVGDKSKRQEETRQRRRDRDYRVSFNFDACHVSSRAINKTRQRDSIEPWLRPLSTPFFSLCRCKCWSESCDLTCCISEAT